MHKSNMMVARILLLLVLIVAVGLVSVNARAGNTGVAAYKPVPFDQDQLVWQLSSSQVIGTGTAVNLPEGILVSGVTIRANATTDNQSLFASGRQAAVFEIKLTVFSPAKEMPGQKAGMWYLTGEWTMTEADADSTVAAVRHNPSVVRGSLSSELAFNPLFSFNGNPAEMNAVARIPMSLSGGRWVKAEGEYRGSTQFDGLLSFDARLWPWTK